MDAEGRALVLALAGGLGAALLLAAWAIVRAMRVARQAGALARAAERVAGGHPAGPLPAGGDDAAGRLAAALGRIERGQHALRAELGQRVAEAEAIVGGIAEGVYAVDRERRIRYANPQFERLLGLAPGSAAGRFCGDVLRAVTPGGGRPCAEDCPIVHARFRGGASATEQLVLADGTRRSVVVTSAGGGAALQVQVLREETEREATGRLRDAVLANISHEFRTPLSAQLASLELLVERLPELDREAIGSLVASLQRGTLRLAQLVDNLLESVRLEAGETAIRRRALALDEVVEEALETTRPLLAQRGQHVDLDLPYPLPPVPGDGPRLVQVFVNLLANAAKFAPGGSTVRVGGAVRAEAVELWVEDEGPGLPDVPEGAPFTRFWRAAGEEPEQGGAGLGLFIVKSIVERHGGRVTARSGVRGTRMCIILPREESPA